jgi:RimJ/RimL family protein N-acetyltransferase
MIPTLTTDRLTLRAISPDDWEPYAAMWADPRVTEFIGGEPRAPSVAWPKFVQSTGFWLLFGYGYWTITDRDGRFIGIGGFAQQARGIPELVGHPECGWTFVADVWGRGIASEAVAAMVDWADGALAVETRCLIDRNNAPSIKVATRNGYVCFGDDAADPALFRRPMRLKAEDRA